MVQFGAVVIPANQREDFPLLDTGGLPVKYPHDRRSPARR